MFLVAPYSEALFLAGAIPAFYAARRGLWTRAGIPAALATATRAAGLFLLFGLALEFLRQRDFTAPRVRAAAGALCVGALPVAAYCVWLGFVYGNPLQFVEDQRLGWGRRLTNPVTAFANTWNTWRGADYPSNWIFAWRVEVLAALVGVGLFAWTLARREWGYAGYVGVTMAALLTSTWYFSIPRMLLSLFPGAVFLAAWARPHPLRRELLIAAFAPMAALGVIVFTRGAWFY